MRVRRSPAMIGCALAALVGGAAPRPSAAWTTPGAHPLSVLRVATSADYAPFTAETNGAPTGMDVEIAERLGSDLGMAVEFVRVPWPDLTAATRRGDFDIAMGGVTVRADRALAGRYTRPYATVGAVAVARAADARLSTLDALDAPDVRIAVNAGGHLESVARARFPHATIRPVADNARLREELFGGRADAAVTDTAELHAWAEPRVRVLGPFRADHKAYLLPADRDALAARVDAWLAAREADGWLNRERVHWLGSAADVDAAAAARESVAAFIRLRLELMPAVAAAKHAAGLPIEDRAQEARVIERARSLSAHPDRAAAVYAQLIELAKLVERAAPALPDAGPSLAELRDAIGRTDVALVRALDGARTGSAPEWKETLQRVVIEPGIGAAQIDPLADVLSRSD
jgi:cyclohexadienyl dehydratase